VFVDFDVHVVGQGRCGPDQRQYRRCGRGQSQAGRFAVEESAVQPALQRFEALVQGWF
jgi:hypothetical protein